MNKLINTDNSMVITRRKGGWEAEDSIGGINGDGRRLDLGWGTHNTDVMYIIKLYTWNL